jgi:hypothetical protein
MTQGTRPGTGLVLTVTIAAMGYAAPSYAYLDPGTGSIILQSILAGIAVAAGFLRMYWHRFKSFLSSLTGASRETETHVEQDIARDTETSDQP